jgi:hypothetical protein
METLNLTIYMLWSLLSFSSVQPLTTTARPYYYKLNCFVSKQLVFKGFSIGGYAIKVGRKNELSHTFINAKNNRRNTIYSNSCDTMLLTEEQYHEHSKT